MRQKVRMQSSLLEDEIVEQADMENDFVTAVPVSNPFDPLGKISIADLEEKDETQHLEADPNLISRDLNQNKPPCIESAAPQSETNENQTRV